MAITKISNSELFSRVFKTLFHELDGFNVDADIIARGCADLARTIRERSQYERRNYYHNVSDMIEHLRHDPDLKLTNEDWIEFEQCSYLAAVPITGADNEIQSNRFIIAGTCFIVTRLDKTIKPLELVYYSIN